MRATVLSFSLSYGLTLGAVSGQAELPQGPHHAVVIGVDHYSDRELTSLQYPEADARSFGGWLSQQGWRVTLVLPGGKPAPTTKARILEVVDEVCRTCPSNGTILVYFSGHGGTRDGKSYIFAQETTLVGISEDGVLVADLVGLLTRGGRSRSALLVDGCRNPVGGTKGGTKTPSAARWDDLTVSAGHLQYFGTSDGQTAEEPRSDLRFEGQRVTNGLFTHLLVRGLSEPGADTDGDGFVGLLELHRWLQPKMKVLRDQNVTQQVPELRYSGSGDIVLGRAPADRVPPAVTVEAPAIEPVEGYVTLEGSAVDPGGVIRVVVQLPGGREEIAQLSGDRWKVAVKLAAGGQEVAVQAFDRAGNVSVPVTRVLAVRALAGAPGPASSAEARGPTLGGARVLSGFTAKGKNEQGYEEYTLNKDPSVVMILVPGGEFTMGSTDSDAKDNEKPLTTVTLGLYLMGKYETTWAQYVKFCAATSRKTPERPVWGKDDHPVVNVDWSDARDYCAWAGLRLPTEAEWEYAACGREGRKWPWGGEEPTAAGRWCNMGGFLGVGGVDGADGYENTSPVGSFAKGVGPIGTLDQAGNVWEWCSDRYAPYPGGRVSNPQGPSSASGRVNRGGSWLYDAGNLRGSFRNGYEPSYRVGDLGFRPASQVTP